MEWVILFIASWILFFAHRGWKGIKNNIWCGIAGIVSQMLFDSTAMEHGLYAIRGPVVAIDGSSVFFALGPVFVVGVLIARYHPGKRLFMVANAVVITALYTLQEFFLVSRGVLIYLNWHIFESILLNILAMVFLSWFSIAVLGKKVG